MSWQDRPGPTRPTMQSLVEEELHLVLACGRCHRELRITPWKAVAMFGATCTVIGARRKMRCSWCGERQRVDARPCTLDMAAKRGLDDARRQLRAWPDDKRMRDGLAEAEAAWEARRPRQDEAEACD